MPIPSIKIVIAGVDKFSQTLGNASKSISKFGAKTAAVGKSMTMALTIPIAVFGALSVREFAKYETSLARVQALTGATTEQMSALNNMTKTLGSTTRYGATQSAQGIQLMVESGFKLNESIGALPEVLRLSTIAQIDMNAAVETADLLADAYNVNISEMAQTNDMMASAALAGEMGVGALTKSLQSMSPVAQAMGLSLKDTVSAVALISKSGLPIERSLKGLKSGLLSLQTPSGIAIKTFKKLGIKKSDLFDSTGKLKSLIDVMKVFEKTGASSKDMADMFGDSVGSTMAVMLSKGSGALQEIQGQLTGTTGLAKKLSDALGDTAQAKIDKFTNSLGNLYIAFAENIIPILIPIVNGLIRMMNWFGNLSKGTQHFISVIVLVVAAIGPLLLILGKLVGVVSFLMGKQIALWGVIKGLGSSLMWLGKFLIGLNPVVLLIAAAVGVWSYNVYQLYKGWQNIVDVFSSWGMVLRTVKFFIEDIITSMARIALPKFLERAFGLTAEVTPAGGLSPTATAAAIGGAGAGTNNKSEVKVSFDNVPKGTRITAPRSVALSTYFGQTFAGAE
jgi:TP901 family phage tail tape measure protein